MDRPKATADSVTVKPEQKSPPTNSTSASATTSNNTNTNTYGNGNSSARTPDLSLVTAPSPSHSQNDQTNGPQSASPLNEQRASKIAACLACRRSKVRCEKGEDPVRCRRCSQTGSECVRPTFNVGRRKGVKK
jgi:hypothetical protein